MIRAVSYAVAIGIFACAIAACGHMPWGSRPGEAPRAVSVLQELAEDGTATYAFPQYWKRNTLVIDLQGAGSSGKLILKPREGKRWPARVAFRARPGSLGLLEVMAEQRMLIPITREGTEPVDVDLIPGVYTAKTPQMTVEWGR